eukprot:scaffold13515_cov32-Tisochrysis_lutea.AAC.1
MPGHYSHCVSIVIHLFHLHKRCAAALHCYGHCLSANWTVCLALRVGYNQVQRGFGVDSYSQSKCKTAELVEQ